MDYPNRLEWQTRCEFNAYCKRALRNELIDACRERKRRQLREVIFSDLTPQEERQLYTVDKYFQDGNEEAFCAGGLKITAKLLAEALHTLPDEKITVAEGNATDLSAYADHAYDITLLLGPMYHLFTEEEKKRALSEAVRVTKPGGILFVAYCMNDATVIQYGFMRGNLLNGTEIKKGLSIGKPFVFPLPPRGGVCLVPQRGHRRL